MLDTLLMLHVNSISIKLEEKKSILNKNHERSPKLVLQVLYYYISCEIRDALSPSKHHSYRVSCSIPHYGYTPELQQVGGCCLVAKSCLFCDPMDCSPPGSSVHGISQTRILEWVSTPSSRDLPNSGTESASPVAPALQADSLPLSHWGSPQGGLHVAIGVIQKDSRISLPLLQAVSTLNTGDM